MRSRAWTRVVVGLVVSTVIGGWAPMVPLPSAAAASPGVLYVLDVSGSTSVETPACGDHNADGVAALLDCEIALAISFNDSFISASPMDAGIVRYDGSAELADVRPEQPGIQAFTDVAADGDGNGLRDIDEVLRASESFGGSDLDDALSAMLQLAVQQDLRIALLTDGHDPAVATGAGSPLEALADTTAVVDVFHVGASPEWGCQGSLALVSDVTGGTCTPTGESTLAPTCGCWFDGPEAPSLHAEVAEPIASDGSSLFNVRRGSIPLKFTLTLDGAPTCALPAATLRLTRIEGASTTVPAESGTAFRVAECQYIRIIRAAALGPGTYRAEVLIDDQPVGSATFGLA